MIDGRRTALGLSACLLLTTQAAANDSIAGVGAGGLILGRTDAIEMIEEDLFISMDEVRVDYVFLNRSDKDIESIVAFPMPDIASNPYSMPMLPYDTNDNFLGFEVTIDGKPVEAKLEQRAFAVGVEVTDELQANGIAINPFTDAAINALDKLPEDLLANWIGRGMVFIERYDAGNGWEESRAPLWTLKSTYHWTSKFPAGKQVRVSHKYLPSVGASAGVSFYYDNGFRDPYAEYKSRYCIDEAFEQAVRRAAGKGEYGTPQFSENRLQYVLTTGGNWALGTIGAFHLTIDKGDPKNLVSFCGNGVKKTGPTTFEMNETSYYPAKDIEVLILKPYEMPSEENDETQGRGKPPAGAEGGNP